MPKPHEVAVNCCPPASRGERLLLTKGSSDMVQLTQEDYGSHEGQEVRRFTWTAADGFSVSVISYGATITSIMRPAFAHGFACMNIAKRVAKRSSSGTCSIVSPDRAASIERKATEPSSVHESLLHLARTNTRYGTYEFSHKQFFSSVPCINIDINFGDRAHARIRCTGRTRSYEAELHRQMPAFSLTRATAKLVE
ncbi:hypothetical protein EVAR_6889_1 [Eumeta japonica]|uniref:Uncharacterized protein n=1 Tax=Eumeta variegata TaxID=151549 RepID=A0A4C1TJG1_EUMVA|nr:hypothetical protein EVAR_6889_1 [Eumeta japonica]